MINKDGFRKHMETVEMPNGKEYGQCSRLEIYDMLMESMQFINQQHAELTDCKQRLDLLAEIAKRKEQSTLLYKIKNLFNDK